LPLTDFFFFASPLELLFFHKYCASTLFGLDFCSQLGDWQELIKRESIF
jgi:hypothetical protein